MKIVIFAGGVGTRLWPLSRKNTPKQFGKIIGDKSTLQQAVYRLTPDFSPANIYVVTGKKYKEIVTKQLKELPKENFIFEPTMRDVGPAIGLVSSIFSKSNENTPIAILWSDHLVKNEKIFRRDLHLAEDLILKKKADFVFIAQKPRFANQNIGWIKTGNKQESVDGADVYRFEKLIYRPKLSEAQKFVKDKNFVWNLGYFVSTPKFLLSLFQKHSPLMYREVMAIQSAWDTKEYEHVLDRIYPTLEKISFDDAILQKITESDSVSPNNIAVISDDLGWSDVGGWEALKEALAQSEQDNVTRGKVLLENTKNSLIFNYTDNLTVAIDLDGLLVINTEDVLLVCKNKSVPKIKKLVESMSDTPHEHLT